MCVCLYICIHTVEYYSVIKRWNSAISNYMDGSRNYHTKRSKRDRERHISYDITDMWNLKKWYKWNYLQNRLADKKQTYDYQKRKEGDSVN